MGFLSVAVVAVLSVAVLSVAVSRSPPLLTRIDHSYGTVRQDRASLGRCVVIQGPSYGSLGPAVGGGGRRRARLGARRPPLLRVCLSFSLSLSL